MRVLEEGEELGFAEILAASDGDPLVESQEARVIVPKRGKLFADDGSMEVSIIRPCVSRGKMLRGLHPIYTPGMLEANAGVFTGWPMYQDHMLEQAVEEMEEELMEMGGVELFGTLQERARKIKELGGRVVESFYDPNLTFKDDEDFGFQPGGVRGRVIPQKSIREMLEADPEILNVSINAYPTGGKAGTVPWNPSQKGLLIEGIRRKPMGSVDWVFRGGAGGRPLIQESTDERRRAAVVLEQAYDYDHDEPAPKPEGKSVKTLKEMNADELREHLEAEGAGHLIGALAPVSESSGDAVTRDEVTSMLSDASDRIFEGVQEIVATASTETSDQIAERLEEEKELTALAESAAALIAQAEKGGLSQRQADVMRERYAYEDGIAAPGLLGAILEADDEHPAEVVTEENIKAEITDFIVAVRESGGDPMVEGFGPSGEGDPNDEVITEGAKSSEGDAFVEGLQERGDLADPDDPGATIKEMFEEN